MAEEKWILQFNKKTVHGSVYNPGEKAAFSVRDAKIILESPKVSDDSDPKFGEPAAVVIKKLTAQEVAEIEDKGQPLTSLTVDMTKFNAQDIRDLKAVLDKVNDRTAKKTVAA